MDLRPTSTIRGVGVFFFERDPKFRDVEKGRPLLGRRRRRRRRHQKRVLHIRTCAALFLAFVVLFASLDDDDDDAQMTPLTPFFCDDDFGDHAKKDGFVCVRVHRDEVRRF